MLDLESGKRVTWALSPDVHSKLNRVAKSTGLSLQEVANLIMQSADLEGLKPSLSRYIKEKKQSEERKKKAAETVSKMTPEMLERINAMNPEDLEKILAK